MAKSANEPRGGQTGHDPQGQSTQTGPPEQGQSTAAPQSQPQPPAPRPAREEPRHDVGGPQPPKDDDGNLEAAFAELGDVIAEVDDGKNNNLLWGPTQERLRGVWDWSNLPKGATSERGLHNVPRIPGRRIAVDFRHRLARVLDPLNDEEQQERWAEVKATLKTTYNVDYAPAPNLTYPALDNDTLATWLYWLIRAAQSRQVRLLRGRLPTLQRFREVFSACRVRTKFFDPMAYTKAEQEEAVEDLRTLDIASRDREERPEGRHSL